jgi:hypothetical protein
MAGMGGWNPWRSLRAREHLDLEWRDLPPGVDGAWVPRRGGRAVIVLAARLTRRARRCALAHELVHDERGIVTTSLPAALAAKEERAVDLEVARRMVPSDELRSWITARLELGEPVTAHDVAEEWDVTEQVALQSLRHLQPN